MTTSGITAWAAGVRDFLLAEDKTVATKIFLAIFDKAVLGLLLLVVGVFVQGRVADDNYRIELSAKMYETQTNLISVQRQKLVGEIGTFLADADRAIDEPQNTSSAVERLDAERTTLTTTIDSLSAFYSSVDIVDKAGPMIDAMTSFQLSMSDATVTGGDRMDLLNAKADLVRTAARQFYGDIDSATLSESVIDSEDFLQRAKG